MSEMTDMATRHVLDHDDQIDESKVHDFWIFYSAICIGLRMSNSISTEVIMKNQGDGNENRGRGDYVRTWTMETITSRSYGISTVTGQQSKR